MRFLSLCFTILAAPVWAEAPRVAVDIPPVHGLVSEVMEGVGTPDLILPPGASPHDAALRPSDAQRLEAADLVIWVGPELSPAITRSIEALTRGESLVLLDVPGLRVLDYREGAVFGAADDDHDHEHGHDHDHEHGQDHGHDHDHGARDPHAWLDPENAVIWLDSIAAALARIDPVNAAVYAANAQDASARITAQTVEIAGRMEPLRARPFIVFHDAYHYFEARFGIEAAGAIAVGDGVSPGPRRLLEIGAAVEDLGVTCVFAEPQFNARYTEAVLSNAGARVGEIDPLGVALELGPDFYGALMEGMASSFEACLAPE